MALNEEMADHLGHEKHQVDPERESANGRIQPVTPPAKTVA